MLINVWTRGGSLSVRSKLVQLNVASFYLQAEQRTQNAHPCELTDTLGVWVFAPAVSLATLQWPRALPVTSQEQQHSPRHVPWHEWDCNRGVEWPELKDLIPRLVQMKCSLSMSWKTCYILGSRSLEIFQ